jgi:predicted cupin superfamily sugar epimerase
MNTEAQEIIAKLGLMPLPREGGFYRVTWVSSQRLSSGRAAGSAIYFFLGGADFSALHRMATEEVWHFYGGDPVEHSQFDPADRSLITTRLGTEVLAGQKPQLAVRGGVWQGARLMSGGNRGWALLGCSLSPAWDEAEFELGDPGALLELFPQHSALVRELTR